MNERIKELAEEAKEVSHWLDGGYTPVYHTNLEKFAELIVRECAGFLRDDLDNHFAAEQLVEHFGVE
jgi:hypothetical protein